MIPLERVAGIHLNMPALAWQAAVLTIVVGVASEAMASPRGRWARQLASECDALIGSAVKRPYGWGWTTQSGEGPAERRPTVEMRPPGTPAAGLVLLWSGLLLDESRYTEAAVHVARGVVASQAANGNVVSQPTFGATPGRREPPAAVADRASTRAGMALLLATVGADESKDEMLRRAAIRAAGWLAKQQTSDGGWPSAPPEDAPQSVPARLIRMDERDVRDSTFALLLSASAADDRIAARGAERAIKKFLDLRISAPGRWSNLWTTWYRLDGSLEERLDGFPAGADVLASRRALEALLAGALLQNDQAARVAVRDGARSLRTLRDEQGQWVRLYVLSGEQPTPTGESIFGTSESAAQASAQQLWKRGTFGIAELLAGADELQQLGPGPFADRLSQSATLQERLATAICGLSDSPFAVDWPTTPEEVETYLARHESLWRLLEGPPPDELNARVLRLYVLLLRARLEELDGSRG